MGVMTDVSMVFYFISNVFDCFPVVIKLLIYGSFGGVVFLAVVRSLGR